VIVSRARKREEDPRPVPTPFRGPPSSNEKGEGQQLLSEAEALGIPWRKILSDEILTEGTLRRYAGDPPAEIPLWRAVCILPNSLLQSWRVRALIDKLSWDASLDGSDEAARELKALQDHLCGPRGRREDPDMVMAKHLWFAYHRILELHDVRLAAAKSRGAETDRIRTLCSQTGCSRADAEWGIRRAGSASRAGPLEDGIARAREEGFDLPPAETDFQSFLLLRKLIRRHPLFRTGGRKRTLGRKARKPARPTEASPAKEARFPRV